MPGDWQMDTPFSQEITYVRSNDLLADSRIIIETARNFAYMAINVALVQRNWLLGRRIAEEHLEENGRAEYGKQVIANLAKQLTALYGRSLDATNLYKFLAFYKAFPILDSLRLKSGKLLNWTHYRTLLQVTDPVAREWYMNEAGDLPSEAELRAEIETQKELFLEQHQKDV